MDMERIDVRNLPRCIFSDKLEYANFFKGLIELESDSRTINELWPIEENLTLRWISDSETGRMCAYIFMSDTDWTPPYGDRCELICDGTDWRGVGQLIRLPENNQEVCLQMEDNENIPQDYTTGFSLYRVNMTTTSDRMLSALETFSSGAKNLNDNLSNLIIGTDANNAITDLPQWNNIELVTTLPPLSDEQEKIVKNVMKNHITLIDGPSGSGKTITLLSIVHHLLKENQGRILVCAQTNSLVDHLALSIHEKIERGVVRLFSEIRPDNTRASSLSPEEKFRDYLLPEFKEMQEMVDRGEKLPDVVASRLGIQRKIAKSTALDQAKVICTTCISAGDEWLKYMEFGAILIDDSMLAIEPECMIPIALGCKRVILVGNELQSKPYIRCEEAEEGGLNRSLFERLSIRIQPLRLTRQFRMHPKLWDCLKRYYSYDTSNGVNEDERKLAYNKWPNPSYPFQLINNIGLESQVVPDEFRFINTSEALCVAQLAKDLIDNYHITPDRIGIITQFDDQKNYLKHRLEEMGILVNDINGIEVNKIDPFQGREKDIIIVSCVRSTSCYSFGALKYKQRFHSTLSRAKFGLFVVGNLKYLYENVQNEVWKDLMDYYHVHVARLDFLD